MPTYFTAHGNVLTQVVEHQSGEFAYPIVADPKWWDDAVAWAKKTSESARIWLKKHVTWDNVKRYSGKTGKFLVRRLPAAYLVLCVAKGGWAWYRSDAQGWVRVGDAVVGCIG